MLEALRAIAADPCGPGGLFAFALYRRPGAAPIWRSGSDGIETPVNVAAGELLRGTYVNAMKLGMFLIGLSYDDCIAG